MDVSEIPGLTDFIEEIVTNILETKKEEKIEKWLNLGEAATYIGVSRNTLKKFINKGDIELYAIDGIKRVAQSQLDQFIKTKGDCNNGKSKSNERISLR